MYSRKYRGNKDALGSQEGGTDGTEAGDADEGMRPQSRTTAKPDNLYVDTGRQKPTATEHAACRARQYPRLEQEITARQRK